MLNFHRQVQEGIHVFVNAFEEFSIMKETLISNESKLLEGTRRIPRMFVIAAVHDGTWAHSSSENAGYDSVSIAASRCYCCCCFLPTMCYTTRATQLFARGGVWANPQSRIPLLFVTPTHPTRRTQPFRRTDSAVYCPVGRSMIPPPVW